MLARWARKPDSQRVARLLSLGEVPDSPGGEFLEIKKKILVGIWTGSLNQRLDKVTFVLQYSVVFSIND